MEPLATHLMSLKNLDEVMCMMALSQFLINRTNFLEFVLLSFEIN